MTAILDYAVDARNRIWQLLEMNNVVYRDQLRQSADTAGAQLELVKSVLAPTGTIYIVLAQHEKSLLVHMRPAAGLADCIARAIARAREATENGGQCSSELFPRIVEKLIEKHGRVPGPNNDAAELDSERTIGLLFASIPEAARMKMIEILERTISKGICPALIGLLGKEGVMYWPMPMALAPYADKIVKERE